MRRESVATAIAFAAMFAGVLTSSPAHGQPYTASRYAVPVQPPLVGPATPYGSPPGGAIAPLVPGHSAPFYDYRDGPAASTPVGSSGYASVLDDTCFGGTAAVSEPSGAVWSDPIPQVPHWCVRVGAIALTRNRASSQPFTDGATPTNADDFNPGYQVGPQVGVIYNNIGGTPWGVDVGFFTIDGFQDQTFTPVATHLLTGPPITFSSMDVTSTFESSVTSGEINVRHEWSEWTTFLGGFRYFEVQDDLLHEICQTGMRERIVAENRAYGLQLGFEGYILRCTRIELAGWSKAGLLINCAEQVTTTTLIPGVVPYASASDEEFTFLGDAGLSATYRLTNWLAVRGGYQVLWFEAAAAASAQMLSTNVVTGAAAVDFGSSLLYHGGFGGAELTW